MDFPPLRKEERSKCIPGQRHCAMKRPFLSRKKKGARKGGDRIGPVKKPRQGVSVFLRESRFGVAGSEKGKRGGNRSAVLSKKLKARAQNQAEELGHHA